MPLHDYLTIIRREKKPIRFLASRLICKIGISRFFRIPCEGYQLMLQPASIAMRLWIDGASRDEDTTVLKSVLRPGDTYVDVGANIGQLCLAASVAVGPKGQVYAFEPHPLTYRFLVENIHLNKSENIVSVQAAIGERAAWAKISDGPSDDQNRILDRGFTVLQLRLDDLFPQEHIRLLKIDVEGFEEVVLRGSVALLDRVDIVYCEVFEEYSERYGYSTASLLGILQSAGFVVYRFQDGKLFPVTDDYAFARCQNILACKNEDSLGAQFLISTEEEGQEAVRGGGACGADDKRWLTSGQGY